MKYDQKELPIDISEKDLIAAVAGLRPEFNRVSSLKTLLQRGSKQAPQVLSNAILDTSAPTELRSMAAVALGRDTTQEKVLLKSIETNKDPAVLRRIAQSLGRIGTPESLDTLRQIRLRPESLYAQNVLFACTLISCRYGLGQYLMQRPAKDDILKLDERRGVDLDFEQLAPNDVKETLPLLSQTLPAINVSEKAASALTCLGSRLWVLLNEEMVSPDAERRVLANNAVMAVVVKREHCPEGWHVFEYILSQPGKEGHIDIFGVRPAGVSTHFGQVKIGEKDATVQLDAVNTPYALPLVFEAVYNKKEVALKITKAISAKQPAKNQRRPKVPQAG